MFIENCPPEFQLIEEQCTCEENINTFKNVKCNIDSGLIKFPLRSLDLNYKEQFSVQGI